MARWLQEMGVKTVAMESTGVYWVPVYEILEDHGMEVVLANARQARAVPGRKSDVSDAQWLQRLPAWAKTGVKSPTGRQTLQPRSEEHTSELQSPDHLV